MTSPYAVVDIGSHSIKLVLFNKTNSGELQKLDSYKEPVSLYSYINKSGVCTEQGIALLISTLQAFKKIVQSYSPVGLACCATAVLREASNREEVLQSVQFYVGWTIRVLEGREEARYGALAVLQSFSVTDGVTVDIGGGSIEVALIKDQVCEASHSFSFGVLSLAEAWVPAESPPSLPSIYQMESFLQEAWESVPWLQNSQSHLIGIGGSTHAIAKIDRNIKQRPQKVRHGYLMSGSDLAFVKKRLQCLSGDDRKRVKGLPRRRNRTIIPAIHMVETLFLSMKAKSFIISRQGWREGILYEHFLENNSR